MKPSLTSFLGRWLVATALMPLVVAGGLTVMAMPFAHGQQAWLAPFYGKSLRMIVTSPGIWLTMIVLGAVAAQLGRIVRR